MEYWKTTITITVLSKGKCDFDTDPNELDTIRYAITEGEYSGKVEIAAETLTTEELRKECEKQGTDIKFFLWEDA